MADGSISFVVSNHVVGSALLSKAAFTREF